ncbi:hypothetical protein [Deinococcus aluminii]|uniref:Uncharacterized protein n=1 Tax=Deinococcus aluminii TaxID=1656885 RepID=A0ABP9X9C4_9DEIO
MNRFLLFSFLPFVLSAAHAQPLDAATRKGIDAHAFQFSGRHCAGRIEARFDSEMTPSRFKIAVLLVEEALKEAAVKDPAFRYQSNFNDRDLYRTFGNTPKGWEFLMMALIDGEMFLYKCDLK